MRGVLILTPENRVPDYQFKYPTSIRIKKVPKSPNSNQIHLQVDAKMQLLQQQISTTASSIKVLVFIFI